VQAVSSFTVSHGRPSLSPLSVQQYTRHYSPNIRLYECAVLWRLPGNHASVTLGFLALGLIVRPLFQPPRPQLIPHLTSGSDIALSLRPVRTHPVIKMKLQVEACHLLRPYLSHGQSVSLLSFYFSHIWVRLPYRTLLHFIHIRNAFRITNQPAIRCVGKFPDNSDATCGSFPTR